MGKDKKFTVAKPRLRRPWWKRKIVTSINRVYRFVKRQPTVYLGHGVVASRSTIFEGYNGIGDNCVVTHSRIGRGTLISKNCQILDSSVGRFCSLGQNFRIIIGDHPTDTYVSTHPAFYSVNCQSGFTFIEPPSLRDDYIYADENHIISIGNDVWIGDDVAVLNGVTIGDGAIVAARSLVTKDVPPYTIVGGLPAKPIRKRFSDEQIEFLLQHPWFDQPMDFIAHHHELFTNIDSFIDYFHDHPWPKGTH